MLSRKTLLLLPALALAGCAATWQPSGVDQNFGTSVKGATALQVANPSPPPAARPMALDGEAAKLAVDNYYDAYTRPPAPVNVFNIGVGTSSSSGSSTR